MVALQGSNPLLRGYEEVHEARYRWGPAYAGYMT